MYVVNIIGYDYSFNYDGELGKGDIKIPFDHRPYKIPDDVNLNQFKELKKVEIVESVVETKNEDVADDSTSETISYSQDVNNFPKTAAEKVDEPKKTKPLSGVKIKKGVRKAVKKSKRTIK